MTARGALIALILKALEDVELNVAADEMDAAERILAALDGADALAPPYARDDE